MIFFIGNVELLYCCHDLLFDSFSRSPFGVDCLLVESGDGFLGSVVQIGCTAKKKESKFMSHAYGRLRLEMLSSS